ncbi:hypothetical protein apy_02570 [Aeropyrum pernix]|uniref:CBM-cenC domain-containing protein n=2 Tax=Aeropyrum pernix TaxID=56636 RepID=A0A401H863_AERPX|nr:hypothetical protein apy_02570 [Aeropyrum pernix]
MDGTYGLSIRGNNYYVNDKYYSLESILETVYPMYKNHRILVIPFDYYSLIDIRGMLPNYFGLTIGPLINATGLEEVYELLISLHDSRKSSILALYDVKVTVIDKKFNSPLEKFSWYQHLEKIYGIFIFKSQGSYFIDGNVSLLKDAYLRDQYFRLVYEDENFAIFENMLNTSRVYVINGKAPSKIPITINMGTRNLVSNHSFEEGLEHWRIWPGRCASLSGDAIDGNRALLLKDCDGNDKVWSVAYVLVPIEGGRIYKLSFYIKFLNEISGSLVKILWYNQSKEFSDKYAFKVDYIKLHSINMVAGKWYHIN